MRLTSALFRTDFDNYHERIVYKSQVGIPYYKTADLPGARVQGLGLVHDMRFKDDLINVGWTYTYTDSEVTDPKVIKDFDDAMDWLDIDGDLDQLRAECRNFYSNPDTHPVTLDTTLIHRGEHPVASVLDYYRGQWLGFSATTTLLIRGCIVDTNGCHVSLRRCMSNSD